MDFPEERQSDVVVRTSIIILAGRIIFLEIIISTLLLVLTLSIQLFPIPGEALTFLFSFYTLVFMTASTFKIFFIVGIVLNWINTSYEVDQGEICERSGIFAIKEDDFSLKSVEEIKISQSFFGKIFNYGTIELVNPVLNKELTLYNIPNPYKYLRIIKKRIPSTKEISILREHA